LKTSKSRKSYDLRKERDRRKKIILVVISIIEVLRNHNHRYEREIEDGIKVVSEKDYLPEEYWRNRFEEEFSLRTVGNLSLGFWYNRWLYKARIRALKNLLKEEKLDVKGKSVLEIGVGSGYYIDFWKSEGISSLAGLDITEKSVSTLKTKYPEYHFQQTDIAGNIDLDRKMDLITCMDVLYHLVDDNAFDRAISNIKDLSDKNAYIIISDFFLTNPTKPAFHEYHRTLGRYEETLSRNDFRLIRLEPIFYLAHPLLDYSAVNTFVLRFLIRVLWKMVFALFHLGRSFHSLDKISQETVGFLLYSLDGQILRFKKDSPNMKLLLAKKVT